MRGDMQGNGAADGSNEGWLVQSYGSVHNQNALRFQLVLRRGHSHGAACSGVAVIVAPLRCSWVFGDFLCKMYNFVNYLSYTASVMILVVNCVERYVAIMCPFRAKTLLRHRNLVVLLVVVWAGSGVYCCPRLLYFRAGSHELPGAQYTEVICLADRELYDSRTFDTINFVLLYVMPLSVMSLLYWRIGRYLWVNGRQIEEARRSTQAPLAPPGTLAPQAPCCLSAIKENAIKNKTSRSREDGQLPHSAAGSSSSIGCYSTAAWRRRWRHPGESISMGPYHSERLIRTWRKVVKLLVAVVLCFALCNLPFHLRKMLTYYHPAYKPTTDAALMFTPLSNLLMYLNSALNPIVYSFMSHNFRACVRDVLTRYTRRGKRRHLTRNYTSSPPPRIRIRIRTSTSTSTRARTLTLTRIRTHTRTHVHTRAPSAPFPGSTGRAAPRGSCCSFTNVMSRTTLYDRQSVGDTESLDSHQATNDHIFMNTSTPSPPRTAQLVASRQLASPQRPSARSPATEAARRGFRARVEQRRSGVARQRGDARHIKQLTGDAAVWPGSEVMQDTPNSSRETQRCGQAVR
ncbi:hypothetical protein O3P69_003378 [Scylla paramamosain]|uniref:G-protein coupled receptors family 1 profile domain-containing protein n=1 Tax=Scylla paramamosain TaxID=85552 RepID=A0AAW0UHB8_SCYPA